MKSQQAPAPKPNQPQYRGVVRADFYYDRYLLLVLATLVIMAITAAFALWMIKERDLQPTPAAFATSADGKLFIPAPLNEAEFTTPQLIEWAVEAISESFSFSFIDYDHVITNATRYYTKLGFQDYRKTLIESDIVSLVQRRRYVVSVEPTSAPIILKDGVSPDNVYTWQVQFNVQVTYQNVRETLNQEWVITLGIVRVPLSESPEGLAVAAMIAREGRPTAN